MSKLTALGKYFVGGYAEDERDIRSQVFVKPPQMDELLDFSFSNFKVLMAPKGVGKSYLLWELHETALIKDRVSLLIRPKDLDCDSIAIKDSLASKVSEAERQILLAIAGKMGASIDSNVIVNPSEARLYALSEYEGLRKPDLLKKFNDLLCSMLPKAEKFAETARNFQQISKNKRKLQSDIENVLNSQEKRFWLLIDDLDEACSHKDGYSDYQTPWALMAAAHNIASEYKLLICIVSVRTDVWHTMTEVKKLGSDRLDKIQSPIKLRFDESDLVGVLRKRLRPAVKDISCEKIREIECFFEGSVKIPSREDEERSWEGWLSKTARNRPRDLVHLVQMLIKKAVHLESDYIKSEIANDVMLDFAKTRIKNMEREFREICPQISKVIEDISFNNIHNLDDLLEVLSRSPSARAIQVDSIPLTNHKDDALILLRVLHMANYINPRISDPSLRLHYNHVLFDDSPGFVAKDNWKNMQQSQWEIHPTFHSYVNAHKKYLDSRGLKWKK